MRNPYDILGVSNAASASEIKKAFHQRAKKYHPDHNKTDPKANELIAEINAAWEILGDPMRRAEFDRSEIGQNTSTERSQSSTPVEREGPTRPTEPELENNFVGLAGAVLLAIVAWYGWYNNHQAEPPPSPPPPPPQSPSPAKPISVWLSAAPQLVAANSGLVTFSWTAPDSAKCDPVPPYGFHVTERTRNTRSGTFDSAGEKTFVVRCSLSGQIGEDSRTVTVTEPPPSPPEFKPFSLYESYWIMSDSQMGLVRQGAQLRFYYVNPRQGMREVNVRPGTLYMTGKLDGGTVDGTAYTFSKICGALEYEVSGWGNDSSVTVSGNAPMVDSSCIIRQYEQRTSILQRQ